MARLQTVPSEDNTSSIVSSKSCSKIILDEFLLSTELVISKDRVFWVSNFFTLMYLCCTVRVLYLDTHYIANLNISFILNSDIYRKP